MNSLLERSVIESLYEASQAGVQIDLIVRGICSLRPGLKGVSENIRVRSIVGRFLEHSRIFFFENGDDHEVFCGSADWMPRNLFERCETIFPVRDPALLNRISDEILASALADTVKSRLLRSDGEYAPVSQTSTGRSAPTFNSQNFLIRVADGKAAARDIPPAILYPLSDEQPPARRAAKGKSAKKTTRSPRRKKPSQSSGLQIAAAEDDHIESALS
jgi:polyphosphate kinase